MLKVAVALVQWVRIIPVYSELPDVDLVAVTDVAKPLPDPSPFATMLELTRIIERCWQLSSQMPFPWLYLLSCMKR